MENMEAIAVMIPAEKNKDNELVRSQCTIYKRNYSQYPVDVWSEIFTNTNDTEIIDCTNGVTYAFTDSEKTAVMEV